MLARDPQTLWYLEGVAQVATDDGAETPVVELTMPEGAMAPLHVHDEDEAVRVLDGRLTFFVGVDATTLTVGETLVAPRGVPHSYRVESGDGARWQVLTPNGRYARFIRTVSRPAEGPGLPPEESLSVREAVAITAAAAESGIEILAPAGVLPDDL